jgi:hypothetical protein
VPPILVGLDLGSTGTEVRLVVGFGVVMILSVLVPVAENYPGRNCGDLEG